MTKKVEQKIKLGTNFFLFPLSLLLLLTLALWWLILHRNEIEQIYGQKTKMLQLEAMLTAERLSHAKSFPTLAERSPLLLLRSETINESDCFFYQVLSPNWADYTLVIKNETILQIMEEKNRRLFMISGEGAMLIFLLAVPIFMLHRLFWTEKKSRENIEAFFRMVSHELKTPVAGLNALLDTLSSRELDSENVKKYAKLGLQENVRLRSLIDNMLYLQKMDVNIFDGKLTELSLTEKIESFVQKRNQIFPSQKILFENQCNDSCMAICDANLLYHVLANLTDNAFKYSPSNATVSILLKDSSSSAIHIHVIDQGEGIDKDDLKNIFKKFHRLEISKNRSAGIGMGLYIVQKLVGRMNGSVEAVSRGKGKGTTFIIELQKGNAENIIA